MWVQEVTKSNKYKFKMSIYLTFCIIKCIKVLITVLDFLLIRFQ